MVSGYHDCERQKSQMQAFADVLLHRLQVEPRESSQGTELSHWFCDLDHYASMARWLERTAEPGSAAVCHTELLGPRQHLLLEWGNVYSLEVRRR